MPRPRAAATIDRERKDTLIMQLIEGGHSYVEVERMMRSNGTPVTTRYIEKVVAK